jgi:hypothetical protein
MSTTADSSCGELSEAKHPATSTHYTCWFPSETGFEALSRCLAAKLVEVAGFCTELVLSGAEGLRMTL